MTARTHRIHTSLYYAAGIFCLIVIGGIVAWRASHIEERARQWVVATLSDRFQSKVELASLQVSFFPRIGVIGTGLALHHKGRVDVPPLIQIDNFSFAIGLRGIIRFPHRVTSVHLNNMTITIPPRGSKGEKREELEESRENRPQSLSDKKPAPSIIIDEIICNDTTLITLPKTAGKVPLEWDIHDLVLHSVGANQPFTFSGTLTNAKPVGEIATQGTFGPWNGDEPGDTPVSGKYEFTDANLGPFRGIGGTLSSTGRYAGDLARLEVQGETHMNDFWLDKSGTPVPLHTEFSATVDGTNGDTHLHPVRATLVNSVIVANGDVAGQPGRHGKLIELEATVSSGRIEDMLQLALKPDNNGKPLLSGPVTLTARIIIPPEQGKVLDKLVLDGQFGLQQTKWGNPGVREKLEGLSRRAQGQPDDDDAGSAISNLSGRFHFENAAITFSRLDFSVPGAAISLTGTYDIRSEELDFHGQMRMEAKVSQTVTGVKSFFLRAIDPFFAKEGIGAVIPIRITGSRNAPQFGLDLFGGDKKPN